MSRLASIALTFALLTSTVGCMQHRAGYGGGACCAPQGGFYGAPAMQQGNNFYSPSAYGTPVGGQTAFYGAPVYSNPAPMTAFAPVDPLPTY